ncbi:hypothetical protein PPL_10980 [Heterostelium album PN500]|uniref:Uncharacterized protein n=1 Tax=Heterostelium pallidum (strain ATCC 26659 / Pp 5 / PN500) TaxID=670386 RepID=D3BSL1_HETP5|nr:hypothetical protein PPL_10980 [Heterostelium album PN500]EFA75476.1 hypothetical protein PPL_10980 [Heterostelium album PN500]|eukprot:XP_020427610.1 hypothetical protein PPL_10980 [Heterostelium album PN500]
MLINAISSLFSASSSKMTNSVSSGKGSFGSQSANQITILSANEASFKITNSNNFATMDFITYGSDSTSES